MLDHVQSDARSPMLPWPLAWSSGPLPWAIRVGLLNLGVGVFGLFLAIVALLTGKVALALIIGVGAGICGFVLAMLWPTCIRVRTQWRPEVVTAGTTASGERGVSIPQSVESRKMSVTFFTFLFLIIPFDLWVLILAGPLPDFDDGELAIVVVLTFVPVLGTFFFLFGIVSGRLAPSRVLLTASGVFYRGPFKKGDGVFVPWDSIAAPMPWFGPDERTGRYPRNFLKLVRRSGAMEHLYDLEEAEKVEVDVQLLATDPALVYHAIGYYWGRRDARAELGSDGGLRRIQSGDLLVWHPDERALVLAAVRALTDHENTGPVSVPHEYYRELTSTTNRRTRSRRPERLPAPSHGDHLVIHMKILFDEIAALPDPRKHTGTLFHDDEVPALLELGSALDPLVRDLGDRSSRHYVSHPRWSHVAVKAERAARVMDTHG